MQIFSIYKITNTINQKLYIGFSKQFETRKKEHIKTYHKNKTYLQRAMSLYGIENFTFDIIYQSKDGNHCKDVMEPYFIAEYKTVEEGYNMTLGGDGMIGFKKTEEQKRKVSNTMKDLWKSSFGEARRTKEYIEKVSEQQSKLKTEYWETQEGEKTKESISNTVKSLWEDETSVYNTEAHRQNKSNASKKNWENPEFKKKAIEGIKKAHQDPTSKMNSPERVRKISESNKKTRSNPNAHYNSKEATQNRSLAKVKKYIIYYPDGRTEIINGLKQFCQEHDLKCNRMHETKKDKNKTHRGFRCELYTKQ